ncbi:MAG: hypothetical protein OXI05_06475 [Bacteroidota bacterium]|nr:hypothetical protein [Bacteroidota bacterium]
MIQQIIQHKREQRATELRAELAYLYTRLAWRPTELAQLYTTLTRE